MKADGECKQQHKRETRQKTQHYKQGKDRGNIAAPFFCSLVRFELFGF